MNLLIFITSFFILLISIIGYGIFFQKLCFNDLNKNIFEKKIYVGFYGLITLTFISLFSSLFFPHSFLHNIILHFLGVLFFIFFKSKKKKNYIIIISTISVALFSILLISKTHDDFSYYHLPFTKYLTEHKIIFGMSNLGHGYKLLSSIFFLNSTLYLPFIEYFSFHFSSFLFLVFFNFFILIELFKKNLHDVIKFLYLLALLFFNLSFNRLAEFGTDKAGQLLIVLLIIKIIENIFYKKRISTDDIVILLPLFGLCISLKTYFLPYFLIFFILILISNKKFDLIKNLLITKSFLMTFIFLLIYFFHHFVSTGCIVSPLDYTCFGDVLSWADGSARYKDLAIWLEQWAKAGAGPGFRVTDHLYYIENFNWLTRWFKIYFLGKVFDQLLILLFVLGVVTILFKRLNLINNKTQINKKILLFYLLILIIFFIWFSKHPQLRYGGYAIGFLTLSLPISIFLQKFSNKNFFRSKLKVVIIAIILIVNIKNIDRIKDEFVRTDLYKFENFPFYSIPVKKYISEKTLSGLTLYRTEGHCWNVPSPCFGSLTKEIIIKKKNDYYFIQN